MEYTNGEYSVSTEQRHADVDVIHKFLSEESYWAKERPKETVERAVRNSLCFSLLRQEKLVGFARVITDYATFSYICDLFVLPDYRRKGLGKWLVECILDYTQQQGLKRWLLATSDAHGLYAQYGFSPLEGSEYYMVRRD